MIIINRGDIIFYVMDESITVGYNGFQFFSYSVYALQNRSPFYSFKEKILESNDDEFRKINEVVSLALHHNLASSGTTKPKLENYKCEYL